MIEARNLYFTYEGEAGTVIPAIQGLNLSIPEGSYVAVIGPNGSGKSTLARLLAGVITASSGELRLGGLDPERPGQRQKLRTAVGLILQNPDNQLVSVTVEREIAFGLENLGLPREEMRKRVDWALEKFDLKKYRFHSPNKLSGGEKQRLAIAATLAMEPSYLIFDEPTSFLDPAGRNEILSDLDRIHAAARPPSPATCPQERSDSATSGKFTIVHITQFAEEACRAQRVVVLDQGRVFLEGRPQEVFSEVENLEKIGLRPPQLGRLQRLLEERGLNIAADFCSADRFQRSLFSLRRKEDKPRSRIDLAPSESAKEGSVLEGGGKSGEIATLKDVWFQYRDFASLGEAVLSEVNLSIGAGEFIGLVGPTGSGKSTLANLISGLLEPTSGDVSLHGRRGSGARVGLILQFPERQFFQERVADDIAYGLKNLGCGEDDLKRELGRALQLVNLRQEFSNRQVYALSGGEKRRVAIASILALRPDLLVLDEPFIALDPEATEKLKETLRGIHNQGTSILLISHDMEAVFELAKRLLVLKEGRVIADLSSLQRELWPEAVIQSGLLLPEHLTLLRQLQENGWEVGYGDLTLEGTASQIAESLLCTQIL